MKVFRIDDGLLATIYSNLLNVLILSAVPLAISVLLYLVYFSYSRFILRKEAIYSGEIMSASFGFGVLALCVGLLMALSRAPAVGTVVPAVLSLIGGFALYLVNGKDGRTPVTLSATLSFALMFLYGGLVGADLRIIASSKVENAKYDLVLQKARAELEFRINTERRFLGLTPIAFDQ